MSGDRDSAFRIALEGIREPSEAMIEAGGLGIMNERIAQVAGIAPFTSMEVLHPRVRAEVRADARAAWRAMFDALLAAQQADRSQQR